MDLSVKQDTRMRMDWAILLIAVSTTLALALNWLGLLAGITGVLPHLFYVPIILCAYIYPRWGIIFACLLSVVYCGMTWLAYPDIPGEIIPAVGRVILFILIAGVVAFLIRRTRESEKQFRGVAERSSDLILLTDAQGRARYISPSGGKILGWDAEEVIGHLPDEFIHPDDLALMKESVTRVMMTGVSPETILRIRKKDGNYAMLEFTGSPIDYAGGARGIQVIGRDITERQRNEAALRASEERYRMLADYTYDWEFWMAPDETILYTTPSCERITGYTAREFAEDKGLARRIIHPDDSHALDHHVALDFTRPQLGAVDFRIIHRNGEVRWIGHVCQPIYSKGGEFIGRRRVSNRDITMRRRMETELMEANRRLGDIIDFLPDPTMVIDADAKVTAWNRAMEALTGIPSSDILGKGDYAYAVWFYGTPRPILIDLLLKNDF